MSLADSSPSQRPTSAFNSLRLGSLPARRRTLHGRCIARLGDLGMVIDATDPERGLGERHDGVSFHLARQHSPEMHDAVLDGEIEAGIAHPGAVAEPAEKGRT